MANNSFNKLTSQDMLSAHINGLADAIVNMEKILNLTTSTMKNKVMYAISDIDEDEYNYRIYECEQRGWLSYPAPVIMVNNVVQAIEDYEIQPAFGVVIFYERLQPTDVVTVSCTYISSGSTVIENISKNAGDALSLAQTNQGDIETLTDSVGGLGEELEDVDNRVAILESGGGGGGSTTTTSSINGGDELNAEGKLEVIQGDVYITHSTDGTLTGANAVAVASNSIDAFPIYIDSKVVVDKIKSICAKVNHTGALSIMGLYTNVNGYPHTRIAQTPPNTDAVGDIDLPFREGEIVLEKGIYWVARFTNAGTQYDGIQGAKAIEIIPPSDADTTNVRSGNYCAGVRTSYSTETYLPTTFPTNAGGYFSRGSYASIYLHIKKNYR